MKKILTFAFLASIFEFHLIGQNYFPPPHGFEWEKKPLEHFKINIKKLNSVISFAKENEYRGSKDLRIAINKGFENEPYHKILGPTKKKRRPCWHYFKGRLQDCLLGRYKESRYDI